MPTMQKYCDQGIQTNAGGSMQVLVPATVHALASTIPLSSNITSNLILSDGMKTVAVGVKSTKTGAINVQRYLDDAGLVPQGAALTTALAANTAAVLNVTDGNPFASFTVNITNTDGAAAATLTNLAILLQG